MTRKERLMQDMDYAIKYKIGKFYIKREIENYKGLLTTIYNNCDFETIKKGIQTLSDDLKYDNGRIVSWGEFSVHEDKYIKQVVLGDNLGEDIYD